MNRVHIGESVKEKPNAMKGMMMNKITAHQFMFQNCTCYE